MGFTGLREKDWVQMGGVFQRQRGANLACADFAASSFPLVCCHFISPINSKHPDLQPMPALVVQGEHDKMVSRRATRKLAEEVSADSTFKVVNGTGHMTPVEAPGLLSKVLLDWLKHSRLLLT
eukprot:NODE_8313_length_415_cov_39.204918_g7444_i0.p1 GENE.NODE_8313_length_415_cov_39.204918_g7444_i0~~NODE_8313_length_415_cov_39.204918_g7444_i0.p1  ORF type:complete len:131 (+),score=27.49 NODE_8313_length_415_cov_39.204918_g7444_i0:26-394(+)